MLVDIMVMGIQYTIYTGGICLCVYNVKEIWQGMLGGIGT